MVLTLQTLVPLMLYWKNSKEMGDERKEKVVTIISA